MPMIARVFHCCLAVMFGLSAQVVLAQGYPPIEAAGKMTLPAGLSATLFASEPAVRQPIFCKCDDRGRLWTIQYLQYPNPAGLKRVKVDRFSRTVYDRKPEPPPHGPRGADRITILEDTDHDGHADQVKDFVSGLNLCTGVEFGYGGVFVIQAPYLLFYPDRDRDDIPDSDPEVLLDGFGLEDAQSLANHLTWGPDGWLYGLNGSTTTCNIRGIEFQQGVWRYHPVSKEFELFCEGGGNIFGLTFDRDGRLFYSANGGLFWHGVQGAYYEKNFGKHGPLHNLYAYGYLKNVPHQGETGRPNTGATIYLGETFPADFRDAFLCGDFLSHTCSWWRVSPNGSTVSAKLGGLLLDSHDSWFGATDVCLGSDGAVYVTDFHDQRTAHPDPDAKWDTSNGRIYRIQATGAKPEVTSELATRSTSELVELLKHRNGWLAQRARRLLAEQHDLRAIPLLKELALADENPENALQGVWGLHGVGGLDDTTALALLSHRSQHVRSWTVRLLGDSRNVSAEVALRFRELAERDASPVVICQLAATARRLPGEIAVPILAGLLTRNELADDPYIPWMIWWGVADRAVSDADQLVPLFLNEGSWKLRLFQENQPRLIRRFAADGSEAGYVECSALLRNTPAGARQLMLQNLYLGLTERARVLGGVGVGGLFDAVAAPPGSTKPDESMRRKFTPVAGALLQQIQSEWTSNRDDPLRLRLALESGLDGARRHIQSGLLPGASADRLKTLLAILTEYPDAQCVPQFLELLDARSKDDLTLPLLGAMLPFVNERMTERLLVHYADRSDAVQSRIRDLLFSKPQSTLAFLGRVGEKQIAPASIPLDQLRRLAVFENEVIDVLVRKHWGNIQPGTPEEKLADIRRFTNDLRAGTGDAVAGKVLFTKHCGECHKLKGAGGELGPDISNTVNGDLVSLLVNIVDPSAVVRKEFLSYVIVNKSGGVTTGLLVEEDAASVTLADAKNKRTRIPRDQIDELKESPTSIMPERLLEQLSPQELRDLFAYLRQ